MEFGVKQGLVSAPAPLLQPLAEADAPPQHDRPAILQQLSGLFVLVLAGLVLLSGMILSFILRGR